MSSIEQLLGPAGRMITFSKSHYQATHADHVAVFNANVCVGGLKRWHGDLDLTLDEPHLRELANVLGEAVVVLSERDARFDNELRPLLENAILTVEPDGSSHFDERSFIRAADRTLRRVPEPEPEHRS